ncbi:hypothetical protein FQN54_004397 [Arachnomyces sp. PD_36]|nr:hypothetical protein FQN54_004397 [Arachnomyces sp. PD_36]
MNHHEMCTAMCISPTHLDVGVSNEEVKASYTVPIIELTASAERLGHELEVFSSRAPFQSKDRVDQFLRAVNYQKTLLSQSLTSFRVTLEPFKELEAYERVFESKIPDLGTLLRHAAVVFTELESIWKGVIMELGLAEAQYPMISSGENVPTKSPREILISLVVNDDYFIKKLPSRDPQQFLPKIARYIDLPLVPIELYPNEEFTLTVTVSDGTPKMFFICYHSGFPDTDKRPTFYTGANEENWGTLLDISKIRRAQRDYRLRDYIPFAKRAFQALREVEEAVRSETPDSGFTSREEVGNVRLAAIDRMREHPSFLGRTTEHGQAFTGSGQSSKCCYLCRGMMGYQNYAKTRANDVKTYLCRFSWDARDGYAHSCAEIAVSFQCAIDWEKGGRETNS